MGLVVEGDTQRWDNKQRENRWKGGAEDGEGLKEVEMIIIIRYNNNETENRHKYWYRIIIS